MRGRTLLIAGLLTVVYAGQAAANESTGIAGSEHDLSGNTYDNGEVCVYCHTPHGSNAGVEAPLWNKPAYTGTYTSYSSTTIDGDVLAVGSVSIACLTCHDGTQAMDAVVNAPGMGNGTGFLGDGALMGAGEVAMLGTDLSNDHPIGIQYSGFDSGSGMVDEDFKGTDDGLQTTTINGGPVWWVDTEETPNVSRDKSDMILYSRLNDAVGGSGNVEPFVECASCHDPHNATEAGVQTLDGSGQPIPVMEGDGVTQATHEDGDLVWEMTSTSVNFLRMSNAGSAICLACHVK